MAENNWKNFNFGKVQRTTQTITLEDGRTLLIRMPKKYVFEQMQKLNGLENEENQNEAYDELNQLMADIMSNNMTGEVVTKEYIEENYDLEEIVAYLKIYGEFVGQLKSNPN